MSLLTYGSVCSGIEAASVAWEPLGWKPAWFSEIEPFPCSVLRHHWPGVPNLGDMTTIAARVRTGEILAPDVLVGGTPCQAFSVAGARAGLSDPRGQLTLSYVDIANAIDSARAVRGRPPAIIVWENVPGVFSSKDNAFGCFLGALAGESCELQPPGGKWKNAGCVYGPERSIAWRVLDAQYFGVAQRRRRVFVVASARDGFDPAAVLFEFEGVRRDSAPSREAEEGPATGTLRSTDGGSDVDHARGGHLIPQAGCWWDGGQVSQTLDAVLHKGQTMPEKSRFPAVLQPICVHGTQDPCVDEHLAFALGRNSGQENAVCVTGDVTHTLRAEGFDGGEDGTGRDQPIVPAMAVSENQRAEVKLTDYIRSMTVGGGKPGQGYPAALQAMAVRRLMPVETERLQGFPDGHTDVPHRKKPAADGPRYKAIGNSKAVPVVRWIGRRIAAMVAE